MTDFNKIDLISRINKLPNILEDKIFLYTSHPIVQGFDLNKRREFRFAVLNKRQFYDYVSKKMDFFKEDENWEKTDEVFNPLMCEMMRKMFYTDKPSQRLQHYWQRVQIKKFILTQNNALKTDKLKGHRQVVKKESNLEVKISWRDGKVKNARLYVNE
tara:strand:- start:16 stop:489 length:474 start_codon:yes stop_codon:yes gene_type:complete